MSTKVSVHINLRYFSEEEGMHIVNKLKATVPTTALCVNRTRMHITSVFVRSIEKSKVNSIKRYIKTFKCTLPRNFKSITTTSKYNK